MTDFPSEKPILNIESQTVLVNNTVKFNCSVKNGLYIFA